MRFKHFVGELCRLSQINDDFGLNALQTGNEPSSVLGCQNVLFAWLRAPIISLALGISWQ